MDAKTNILNRLRQATPQVVNAQAEPALPQPPIKSLERTFIQACEATQTKVITLKRLSELPEAVRAIVNGETVRLWPAFESLDWRGVSIAKGVAEPDDAFGLTGVSMGIAVTGTLVLSASPTQSQSVAVIPQHHLAVVEKKQLLPRLKDALIRLQAEQLLTEQVLFISGPSRTADIEQTMVLGAHGPLAVTVFLVG